jgi:trehalose 6-phosphate phosphatase
VYESGLEGDNSELVERVAGLLGSERAGLVTDVDGTISSIVARPEDATVEPLALAALAQLRALIEVVGVVSGRGVAEARAMVGLDGIEYVGNHGLEVWGPNGPEVLPAAQPWVPRLARVLDDLAQQVTDLGIRIENKGITASLHYRTAPDPARARRALLEILARPGQSDGLRLEEGRMVLNLLPPLPVTKGSAVRRLAHEHDLQRLVYLGDDFTDTNAFSALKDLRATSPMLTLSIGVVGPETPTQFARLADASVGSVSEVAGLLHAVVGRLLASDTMAKGAARVRREAHGQ